MFVKDKDDISYIMGHCFRTISCLNQVLFAMNEAYCINEKKAVQMIDGFSVKPQNYKKGVDAIITLISTDTDRTKKSVEMLQGLIDEIAELK